MNRSALVERMLYVVLLAVFSAGIALILALDGSNRNLTDKVSTLETALDKQEKVINRIDTAVTDLKQDNDAQTLLICKLFLSHSLNLTEQELREIESACQAKIAIFEQQANEERAGREAVPRP